MLKSRIGLNELIRCQFMILDFGYLTPCTTPYKILNSFGHALPKTTFLNCPLSLFDALMGLTMVKVHYEKMRFEQYINFRAT